MAEAKIDAASQADLDALLAGTLDDLADMPEFKNYPTGAHKVTFNWETKVVNKKPSVEFKFAYIEPIEIPDSTAVPPKVKDEASVLCMLKNNDGSKNEFSEGTIKMVVAALKERFPGTTNAETLNAAKGAEVIILTSLKEDKSTNPSTYRMKLEKLGFL